MMRGVRGATTVASNSNQAILSATQELLRAMIERNGIVEDDVASVLFSATPELDDTFPAKAARLMGWTRTALMGFQEADVQHGLPMCIRVLIHWNTDKSIDEIQHVFLRDAAQLRPDLADDYKAREAGESS
ncbi:MAG: chorismate mutase [Chloroflexota bacterium]|nr:chorismate mutase [Chloroflexota bacterium]